MEILFQVFPIIFMVMFMLVFGMILVTLFRGVAQWNQNNHAPRLTVEATVVAKRQNFSRHRNAGSSLHHTSTTYYVTFQVESGDRLELLVEGREYGLLVEGDRGRLTFQGTRFLSFNRT